MYKYREEIEMLTIPHMSNKLASLAAKLNTERGEWLPLWQHSIDTCGVAERLFSEWLPGITVRAMIDEKMTYEQLREIVKLAAMLHDIGKATALFQTRITKSTEQLLNGLADAGLPILQGGDIAYQESEGLSHAAAGEVLLLSADCPLRLAEVVGAHHGKPWQDGTYVSRQLRGGIIWQDARAIGLWGNKTQREDWRAVQSECLNWMLKVAGSAGFDQLTCNTIPQSTAVLLTGLVLMADWIASNEAYFPLLPLGEQSSADAYTTDAIETRINSGWHALDLPPAWEACNVGDWNQLSKKLFGFEPNVVQHALLDAAQSDEAPGLMILEAPMGLGKTEAALLAANALAGKGAGGLFFGLPTQATANAIFDRIVEWGRHQPESNRVSIRLAHGMADMNEKYVSLMAGSCNAAVNYDGDSSERLVVHDWFKGRKQALLADFVVGTVDQVLMAALRQKHVMLRHLGLSGKTVIIDECHAYDTYMNQYLEEALRWLGRYKTPVIMLSATLPAARRADFVAAYLNCNSRAKRRMLAEPWCTNRAYPALTWTQNQNVEQQKLTYDGPERDVSIIRLMHGDSLESQTEVVAALLQDALDAGGCAAVVLNTVRRAQDFAAALRTAMPDATVLLLHSRFVMADRLRNEAELLKLMGKKSTAAGRDRVIVVGTQVIEQSLDFDADVMISDLCPMDLLMQRLGRLHRHLVHDSCRPAKLCAPKCYVLCAGDTLEKGAGKVYGNYLLMRTRALLPDTIRLPGDISRLVNDVYDEAVPIPVEPEGYAAARQADEQRRDELKRGAEAFRIHDPDGDFETLLEGDIPSDDEHARAQVRAGDMSLDVQLLMRLPTGELAPLPWLRHGDAWSEDECPSVEEARAILGQRISLPATVLGILERELTWSGLQQALKPPVAWRSLTWLRDEHILVFDEKLFAGIGSIRLIYSKEMGLQYSTKDNQ